MDNIPVSAHTILNKINRHQEAINRITEEAIQHSVLLGWEFEQMRRLFPPRSGWQEWLSEQVSVSVKTITRLRALARLFLDREGYWIPERWPAIAQGTSTGITAFYQLATAELTPDSVADIFQQLAREDFSKNEMAHEIRDRRAREALTSHPVLQAKVETGDLTLYNAHRMLQHSANLAEPVRSLIVAHNIINTELYPPLQELYQKFPDEFKTIELTGAIHNPLTNDSTPITHASITDLLIMVADTETEDYLQNLDSTVQSISTDGMTRVFAKRGNRSQLMDTLTSLPDGEFVVVVFTDKTAIPKPIGLTS